MTAGLLSGCAAGPVGIRRLISRPKLPHGVQCGDVSSQGAVLWTAADREAKLWFEIATDPSFKNARRVPGPEVDVRSAFTGRVFVRNLPDDATVYYRAIATPIDEPSAESEPIVGEFRTPPALGTTPRDVRFVWSGDTAGQGWGIDLARGGMTTYRTMAEADPDFFIHCGDTIYADGPLTETIALDDGTVWRNVMTEAKSKVAETVEDFRGNHRYNLLDEHVRAFNARVPQLVQWDDHETVNNWYPGEILPASDRRYRVREVDVLAQRARQAFGEWTPVRSFDDDPNRIYRRAAYGDALEVFLLDMRSYRGPNTDNLEARDVPFLGAKQFSWLTDALTSSKATWKIIASDMPLGLVVRDGDTAFENLSNADPGKPRGRERELARLLRNLRRAKVRNVVWLTADVHYTAAHHYSPERAAFTDFDPFWEFVSGPLHAGNFGPNELDATFGPEVKFQKAPPPGQGNLPPSAGLQFFGEGVVAASDRSLTVRLRDVAGSTLYSQTIPAARP